MLRENIMEMLLKNPQKTAVDSLSEVQIITKEEKFLDSYTFMQKFDEDKEENKWMDRQPLPKHFQTE